MSSLLRALFSIMLLLGGFGELTCIKRLMSQSVQAAITNILQTGWLEQHLLLIVLEGVADLVLEESLLLDLQMAIFWCCQVAENRDREASLQSLLIQALIPFIGLCSNDLISFQRSHVQIPTSWEFQDVDLMLIS